jgi:hypothetical protein
VTTVVVTAVVVTAVVVTTVVVTAVVACRVARGDARHDAQVRTTGAHDWSGDHTLCFNTSPARYRLPQISTRAGPV